MVVTGDLINKQVVDIRCGIRSSALGGYGAKKPCTIEPLSVRKVISESMPPVKGGNFAHLAEAEDHASS